MDRGYLDFARLYHLHQALAFFVIRARKDFRFRRLAARPANPRSGLRCDQTIRLTSAKAQADCPCLLRRVLVWDPDQERAIDLLTNLLEFGATTIAAIYKDRC